MWFLDSIVTYLTSVRDQFYDAYLEVNSWVYPFYYLATPLYWLYYAFYYIAFYFGSFNEWVDYVAALLPTILNWDSIYNLILNYFPGITDVINWFKYWTTWVGQEILNWWSSVSVTVQGWISAAVSTWDIIISNIQASITTLQGYWQTFLSWLPTIQEIGNWFSDWWSPILSNIIEWGALTGGQIQELINSSISELTPFLEGIQEWGEQATEFFADPLQWLYDRMEEFFERFW